MEVKSILAILGCIIVVFAFWRLTKWIKSPRITDDNTFKKKWCSATAPLFSGKGLPPPYGLFALTHN